MSGRERATFSSRGSRKEGNATLRSLPSRERRILSRSSPWVERVYATAKTVHVVLDNLSTHFRKAFLDVMGELAAADRMRRGEFPYEDHIGSGNRVTFAGHKRRAV